MSVASQSPQVTGKGFALRSDPVEEDLSDMYDVVHELHLIEDSKIIAIEGSVNYIHTIHLDTNTRLLHSFDLLSEFEIN